MAPSEPLFFARRPPLPLGMDRIFGGNPVGPRIRTSCANVIVSAQGQTRNCENSPEITCLRCYIVRVSHAKAMSQKGGRVLTHLSIAAHSAKFGMLSAIRRIAGMD